MRRRNGQTRRRALVRLLLVKFALCLLSMRRTSAVDLRPRVWLCPRTRRAHSCSRVAEQNLVLVLLVTVRADCSVQLMACRQRAAAIEMPVALNIGPISMAHREVGFMATSIRSLDGFPTAILKDGATSRVRGMDKTHRPVLVHRDRCSLLSLPRHRQHPNFPRFLSRARRAQPRHKAERRVALHLRVLQPKALRVQTRSRQEKARSCRQRLLRPKSLARLHLHHHVRRIPTLVDGSASLLLSC